MAKLGHPGLIAAFTKGMSTSLEVIMVKKMLVSVGLLSIVALGTTAGAWAQPNPNPNAPAHVGTACAAVLGNNPNTGPGAHISDTGGTHFGHVGAAMCGL